ncbi:MAG: hypothetical protein SVV03_03140 [Candidatus Nanohaloarchaea archaeon]|nr:hypothetical protein [Candidatus Nanohaloarchaea archaeon]
MNKLLRYVIYSLAALLVFIVGGVGLFPNFDFIMYVEEFFLGGVIAVAVLTAVSLWKEGELEDRGKKWLMWLFALAIIIPTMYTTGAFIHTNQTTWSAGEIHWHADYSLIAEVDRETASSVNSSGECRRFKSSYLCKLKLASPEEFCKSSEKGGFMCALNDRTGEAEMHAHDDSRIHVEGVFQRREEANLQAFFESFGGRLSTEKGIVYPTKRGVVRLTNIDGKSLKIFVREFVEGNFRWKVRSETYVPSHFQRQPRMDDMFIIYDSTPLKQAIKDVREDGNYKGFKVRGVKSQHPEHEHEHKQGQNGRDQNHEDEHEH